MSSFAIEATARGKCSLETRGFVDGEIKTVVEVPGTFPPTEDVGQQTYALLFDTYAVLTEYVMARVKGAA